jgi:hypothetical protein
MKITRISPYPRVTVSSVTQDYMSKFQATFVHYNCRLPQSKLTSLPWALSLPDSFLQALS